MNGQKKRLLMPLVPLAMVLVASLLVAQGPPGPPNPCANACWQAYLNAVANCHGNAACLESARDAVEACILGCHLTPPR
jgi:hypothetical protein